jgi:hypothetical protein
MCCEVLASIEIATRAAKALRFIGWSEILARAPEATGASPVPYRLPVPSGGYLVPDGIFGIEYCSEGTKSYRFFSLEADRGTMPVSRSKPGQTSYLGKLSVYDEIIRQQIHKSHWAVPNLLVLTVTTSATRMSEIVAKLGAGNPAFLFKATEERSLTAPMSELLTSPWQRAGHAPISIAESH